MAASEHALPLTSPDAFHEALGAISHAARPIVLLPITRREVERRDVGAAVDRLMTLSDSASLCRRFADRLELAIEGYAGDARSPDEIPDVVRHVQAVTRQWRYWLAFLRVSSPSLPLLLRLLSVGHRVTYHDVSIVPGDAYRPECLYKTTQHLLHALKLIHEQYGVDPAETQRRATEIAQILRYMTP